MWDRPLCKEGRCTVCYCSNSFKWREFVFDAPQTQPGLHHQQQGVKLGSRIFRPYVPSFKYVLTPYSLPLTPYSLPQLFSSKKSLPLRTPPFLFGEKVLAQYFLFGEKVLAPTLSQPPCSAISSGLTKTKTVKFYKLAAESFSKNARPRVF